MTLKPSREPFMERLAPHIRPHTTGWTADYAGCRAWWADHPEQQDGQQPAPTWEQMLEEAGAA